MLSLNLKQVKYLQGKFDCSNERHQSLVKDLVKATQTPGDLSCNLMWNTTSLMFNDILRRELGQLLALMTDRECKATVESIIEWYTNEILRWSPEHSTNPLSNLEAEMKHKVLREIRDLFLKLKSIEELS